MRKALSLAAAVISAFVSVHELLYYFDHRRVGAALVIATLAAAVCLLAVAVAFERRT